MADPVRRPPNLRLPVLALLLAVVSAGCLDATPPPGSGAASSNGVAAVVPDLQDADVSSVYSYTDSVAAAAGKADFPDTNPFAYRNPWR